MNWPVGPSSPEIAIYSALVDGGPLTSAQVAVAMHRKEEDVAPLLEHLRHLQLVTSGPHQTFAAAPPDLALGALMEQELAHADRMRRVIADLDRRYRRRGTISDPEGAMELIEGREAVVARADHLMSFATSSIWGMAEEIDFQILPEGGYASLSHALDRGVQHRVLVKASSLRHPGAFQRIRCSFGETSEYRSLAEIPHRMMIVDERIAMMPVLTPEQVEGRAIIIRSSPVLVCLIALFQQLWPQAKPVGLEGEGPRSEEVSEEDGRILTLLINGLTDERIARQLGASPRTVQRRVHAMMARSGSTSRVQLGYEASERGWLQRGRSSA